MKIFWIITLLLTTTVESVHGQDFQTPYALDQGEQVRSRSPEIHFANGKLYLAYFAGVMNIRFTRSMNSGQSFMQPSLVVEGISSNEYNMMLQRAPKFAVAPEGTIHLVWTEDRRMGQGDVWYVRSTDDGESWTQPISISGSDDSMRYPQDFASIAVDSSGVVHVSFLDMRESARGVSDYTQMYHTRSTDDGISWSEPVKVSYYESGDGGTCECCKQEIAASKFGSVYIAYRSNIENKRSIYALRSTDRGITWSKAIRIQDEDWTIMACPTQGPDLAVDPAENLHLTWRDARNETAIRDRIYYDVLAKNENVGNLDVEVTSASEAKGTWPAITLRKTGSGQAPEVYYQSFSLNGNIKRRSLENGVFSEPSPLSTLSLDAELATATSSPDGSVFVAWQESGDAVHDRGDIYFARDIETAAVLDDGRSDLVDGGIINLEQLPYGEYAITIRDFVGRKIHTETSSAPSSSFRLISKHLSSGVYLLEVRGKNSSPTVRRFVRN